MGDPLAGSGPANGQCRGELAQPLRPTVNGHSKLAHLGS